MLKNLFWVPEFGHPNQYTGLPNSLDTTLVTGYIIPMSAFNRHRDDIKVLPYISQAADNINNNDKTEYDEKQSNKYYIEDYEDFARQMPEKYCDFDNFLFQGSL